MASWLKAISKLCKGREETWSSRSSTVPYRSWWTEFSLQTSLNLLHCTALEMPGREDLFPPLISWLSNTYLRNFDKRLGLLVATETSKTALLYFPYGSFPDLLPWSLTSFWFGLSWAPRTLGHFPYWDTHNWSCLFFFLFSFFFNPCVQGINQFKQMVKIPHS